MCIRDSGKDAIIERLARVRKLPSPVYTEPQWRAVEAAVSVLTLAVAELQLVFREHGCVDFAELSIRASAALGQVHAPEDLALALGQRIQHLLVDEFQDTSRTQFELVEKLTAGWEPADGRTLFLVGDPMPVSYTHLHTYSKDWRLSWRSAGVSAAHIESVVRMASARAATVRVIV